ncbi:hypothetical protein HOK51_06565 [Candidatus Woesearchaeota archaeon]|jgi:hypothetical protein|nr:hypothetical protein [Candidatus Woesearchaeota archaeon]MBT6519487.1 hypothetical protein [Candidatus Woesearchaeota archaeon]MBT7368235.1 hypothetical protein [Candidatus Woesearchaeota archaeon]
MDYLSETAINIYKNDIKNEKYAVAADCASSAGFAMSTITSQYPSTFIFYTLNTFLGGLRLFKGYSFIPKTTGITDKLVDYITPVAGIGALALSIQSFIVGEHRYCVEMIGLSTGCLGFSASRYFRSKKSDDKYNGLSDLLKINKLKKEEGRFK